jgi:hypothetical protein
MPTANPLLTPEISKTGRYIKTPRFAISVAATRSCPRLCMIAPTILSPGKLKYLGSLYAIKHMTAKLSRPPEMLNKNPENPPNEAVKQQRKTTKRNACFEVKIKRLIRVTKLPNPSLAPGKGKIGSGKRRSTWCKQRAKARSIAIVAAILAGDITTLSRLVTGKRTRYRC